MFRLLRNPLYLVLLSLTFLIQKPCYSSDDPIRESLKTFFRTLLTKPDVPIPSHITEMTENLWTNYKTTEIFEEITDPIDGITKRGYTTIGLKLPEKFQERLVTAIVGSITDYSVPAYPLGVMNPRMGYKYHLGFLDGQFVVDDLTKMLSLRIQLYQDKRQNRMTNAYRYFMPTNTTHLDKKDLTAFLSHVMHGFVVEWMLLARQEPELAEHPFSTVIHESLSSYLRESQLQLINHWEQVNAHLLSVDQASSLITELQPGKEKVQPTMSTLITQICAYNQIMVTKPLNDTLTQNYMRINQLRHLRGPPNDNGILILFTPIPISIVRKYEFAFGSECLPYYFARLRKLSPADRKKECELFIRYQYQMIPDLVLPKDPSFISLSNIENLDRFLGLQLRKLSDQLKDTRRKIHDVSPGDWVLDIKQRTSTPKVEQKHAQVVTKLPDTENPKRPKSFFERLSAMLSSADYQTFFSRLDIPGYPRVLETESSVLVAFSKKDEVFHKCFTDCVRSFPFYSQKGSNGGANGIIMEAYFDQLKSHCVQIKPKQHMNVEDFRVLGKLWVNTTLEYYQHYLKVAEENQLAPLCMFFDGLNHGLIQRLSFMLESLGVNPEKKNVIKDFFQSKPHTSEAALEFLSTLEQIPNAIRQCLSYPEVNVRFYHMIIDLVSIRSFAIYQPGALQFLIEHHEKISPYLLSQFAYWYGQNLRNAPKIHPLGEKGDARLAGLLNLLIMQSIAENSRNGAQDHLEKKKELESFVSAIQTTLDKLKSFNFKPIV